MSSPQPSDRRALVAIDLGAESCRVSLLRWTDDGPAVQLVHRFPNMAVEAADGMHWDLDRILAGLDQGLRACAPLVPEGVRAIAVDGWAVDYVRLGAEGKPVAQPFCYRDERTVVAEAALHERIAPERMRELTGIQLLSLNTAYQFFADDAEVRSLPWLNLPEYILYTLGARPVSEMTNASHTQMLALDGRWCDEIVTEVGMDPARMPELVEPGTVIGTLSGTLSDLPAFAGAALIAPCCHDTASAIAAVPDEGDDWAYISSGTWSLVGTTLDEPNNSERSRRENFTNLRGADGKICYHRNVNGMWLLRQCMESWAADGEELEIGSLVEAAVKVPAPAYVLDVDDPDLLQAGRMPQRINAQLHRRDLPELSTYPKDAAVMASFIFHSLAARYGAVLRGIAEVTGKQFRKLYIMGGGSRNELLNRLTAEATGLEVLRVGTECSTLGNFASQLAALEGGRTSDWARTLANVC